MKFLHKILVFVIVFSILLSTFVIADHWNTSTVAAASMIALPVKAEKLINLASGYCLDTDGKYVNGGQVRMWECANHPNQTWTVQQVDATSYRLINQSTNYCLDTDGVKKDGGQVRMWQCANHPNQLWEIQDLPTDHYRLKNKASGYCLDTQGKQTNGALVQMKKCADDANQTWSMPKETIIGITKFANLASGYCLDSAASTVRGGGGTLRMWECAIQPSQTWTVEQVDATYFRLVNQSSKFCLGTDGAKQNGAPVSLISCGSRGAQLWEIQNLPNDHYRLKNKASGYCLDTDGSRKNGGAVRMWACVDHPNQTWSQTYRPASVVEIPTVVIKVANDDGSHNAADTFSDNTIKALIDDTNRVFTPDAGIKLVLQKITTLNNTKINRLADWSIAGCKDAEQTIQNPNPNFSDWKLSPSQYEAYQYVAKNYPKQLVIFIRRQTYDEKCNVVNEGGGGFSHADLNFIALSSWGASGTLGVIFDGKTWQAAHSYLAHELGHYMGLTHTMPNDWPLNQNQATTQLNTFCQNNPSAITTSLPDVVWNMDQLSDTPGDTGFLLYNKTLFGIGKGQETAAKNQCLGQGYFQVTSDVCKNKGGLTTNTFTVRPARENVMSYTAQCPYLAGNTTGETRARITPQQADVILHSLYTNRKNLLPNVSILPMPVMMPVYTPILPLPIETGK